MVDEMKCFKDYKLVQEHGIKALAYLQETSGGPEKMNLSHDALTYSEGALNGFELGKGQERINL